MAKRPQNLDLNVPHSHDRLPSRSRPNFYMDLPSPRAGEVPPALSPLDAFALHSRTLARKLEEGSKNGRRMSRLPHRDIADELAKRPGYFRSISSSTEDFEDEERDDDEDAEDDDDDDDKHNYGHFRTETPGREFRPVSHYPMLGNVIAENDESELPIQRPSADSKEKGYFGIKVPRSSSPEPYDARNTKPDEASPAPPSLTSSIDSIQSSQQSSQPRTWTNESSFSRKPDTTLALPKSPTHPRASRSIASIRSVIDSADEDNGSVNGSLEVGPSRTARSPFSPDMLPVSRSPSALSEYSMSGDLPRPSFNFSRPRANSNAKLTVETTSPSESRAIDRKPSNASSPLQATRVIESRQTVRSRDAPSRQNSDHGTDTSGILSDREVFSGDETPSASGASSYVYSKYSLPRGRIIDRDSAESRASWVHHQFKWEEPKAASPTKATGPIPERLTPSSTPRNRSPAPSVEGSQFVEPPTSSPHGPGMKSRPTAPSIASASTDRTIRAGPHDRHRSTEIAGMSPEQHLEKGIESHSSGSLSKSTYHLRLAAKAGLPTAMLLYALACRHGWGMRANQAEGVSWLRRAVDSAGVEFIEGENSDHSQPMTQEQKARKAQFALAIYELGMSYMNGWGIPKDKPLAVRCFEIAGSWGDCDALAEAGFCYTQGVGCRKDVKKAAGFYRQAADKGMNMAGNSWIYKPKYMDEAASTGGASNSTDKSAKGRGRSRTLFGRKKAAVS